MTMRHFRRQRVNQALVIHSHPSRCRGMPQDIESKASSLWCDSCTVPACPHFAHKRAESQ